MKNILIISGSGGQGVMSIGITFAQSAVKAEKFATFMPLYGPEQRGGSAKCTVIVSDEEIISPLPSKCDTLIAMNEQSLKKFLGELAPGGTLIINSSRVTSPVNREDLRIISLPADDIALKVGSAKIANVPMIGAFLGYTNALDSEIFLNTLTEKFASKSPKIVEMNQQAFQEGFAIGQTAKANA